jgi:hypothetical protein
MTPKITVAINIDVDVAAIIWRMAILMALLAIH